MTAVAPVLPEVAGYADLEPLGRGGVADVYRAVQAGTGRPVAIKVLRDVSDASAAWRRCRRELTALLALGGHPHVVGLIDVVSGESPVLVVELVDGGSVADEIDRRGAPLALGEAIRVGSHVASALAAAHARGIVHRDVKPHNLLVTRSGDVKLCDFGIASLLRSPELRHATAAVSLRFASPEDLEGDGQVGPPSDVYSLGATLLHLARGQQLELRDRLVPWAPPGGTGDALDALIAACLRPEPGARPTAAELSERLAQLDAELGAPLKLPAGTPSSGRPDLPSTTLHRPFPGHRPPTSGMPPRPASTGRSSHRRRFTVIAAVAAGIGLAALVGLVLARAGRGIDGAGAAGFRLAARPAGLVELTALAWPGGTAGVCLVQQPGVAVLVPVDCADPHDLERVGGGRLPGSPGMPFPDGGIDTVVDAECDELARRATDAAPAAHGVAIAVTQPSANGWATGDREYQCFIGVPGRRLVGAVGDPGVPGRSGDQSTSTSTAS